MSPLAWAAHVAPFATAVPAAAPDPAQLLPARQMMAFTLGFHIVLVPFGVAFTFLMLIANYRGIRRADQDALVLARRWSQVAAVLFAVGAVSGTVLSFEMGLLWPGLMSRFGAAYGFPFAIEGLFFFLEAIFVAVYIYGWDRLAPWPHFWTGVPVVLAGVGGTASVVAANSWMNQPGGITLRDGVVVDVRPLQVFFNRAFWYETIHMLLAAYMVAGFIVAGVYAAGRLKGRRDRRHRLGLLIPFTVAAIATPIQIFVGDVAAARCSRTSPRSSPRSRRWQPPGPTCPRASAGSWSTAGSGTPSRSPRGRRCCRASVPAPGSGAWTPFPRSTGRRITS
jgi:cytochrome d ubiquinol oxidase subunit I